MTYRRVYQRYRIVECGPGVAYDWSGRTTVRPDCGTASFHISPNRRGSGSCICIMYILLCMINLALVLETAETNVLVGDRSSAVRSGPWRGRYVTHWHTRRTK